MFAPTPQMFAYSAGFAASAAEYVIFCGVRGRSIRGHSIRPVPS